MEDLFQADQIQGLSCGGSCSGGILSGRGSLGGMYSGTDPGGIDNDSSILEYFITRFLLTKTSLSCLVLIVAVRKVTPRM